MDTSIICSLPMLWHQLSCFLYRNSFRGQPITGDGFCFLNAVELVLHCDYGEVVTLDDIVTNIPEYFATNTSYSKWFHTVDLLWDTKGYFQFGSYCESI